MQRLTAMLIGALLLLPYNAFAGGFLSGITQYKKGNIKLGPVAIHPYAGLEEVYDSNIYLVPPATEQACLTGAVCTNDNGKHVQQGGGQHGAMITNAAAGVKLNLPLTAMHKFALNYGLNWKMYHR